MEKAIDIKRRAQRCLQSGDLDGAAREYEKLTRAEDAEPITFVLLADLLYKRGDHAAAVKRYLEAVGAYTQAGLYKNAIAVCKKMTRLALASGLILQRLAELHALDGLATEAALYYQELAEFQAHERRFRDAAGSARLAFQSSPENVRLLERAADWLEQAGDAEGAAATWMEASRQHTRGGRLEEAARAEERAEQLSPGASVLPLPESEPEATAEPPPGTEPAAAAGAVEGLEGRRVFTAPEVAVGADGEPVPVSDAWPAGSPAAPEEADAPARDTTPPAPEGLRFDGAAAPPPTRGELETIEQLLAVAAEKLRQGEHEAAGETLAEAARAYEGIGRLDSAAAVFRNLGRGTQATPEILGLWLRNCEQRGDDAEAAEVACALGDRALNEGDRGSAREWFERALRHAPGHELATRRMERLGGEAAPAPPAAGKASTEADGRVEVAVGRAQAVTLDLSSLLAEFQRGIESQLSGDAQSHYDLGMTYREMGLFDQAVECFRTAAQDPAFRERTAEMIGRSLLDQGRFDEAAEEFARALETLPDGSENGICLRFHLGLAHEVAGRTTEALAEFERVYAVQPNYPDVAQKIRVLRRTPESV